MIPPIQLFRQALLAPDLMLTTLCEARPETDAEGQPLLHRTSRFAECTIRRGPTRELLFLPLSPSALSHIERTVATLHRLQSDSLTSYIILGDELHWFDAAGREQRCDLVLQTLPEGCSWDEALSTSSEERLLLALDHLQEEFHRLGFTHNNLKASNLWWNGKRFIPLRYHDARISSDHRLDDGDFDRLRAKIRASFSGMYEGDCTTYGDCDGMCVHDGQAAYSTARDTPSDGHLWRGNLFEGLRLVEDETGYGFVDGMNRTVIPSRYLWAGDFHEGRAEVETREGMGLIDRHGEYIIPPRYEVVDYLYTESRVRVRLNGRWALFDYLGRRITEFAPEEEAIPRKKNNKTR